MERSHNFSFLWTLKKKFLNTKWQFEERKDLFQLLWQIICSLQLWYEKFREFLSNLILLGKRRNLVFEKIVVYRNVFFTLSQIFVNPKIFDLTGWPRNVFFHQLTTLNIRFKKWLWYKQEKYFFNDKYLTKF